MPIPFLLALVPLGSDCTPSVLGLASPSVGSTVLALADEGGGLLALGGQFGEPLNRVAQWNGRAWLGDGVGLAGTVYALARFDSGGGARTVAGGEFPGGVAVRSGTTWSAFPGGPDAGVHALAPFDDGGGMQLYAGGPFLTTGGASVRYLARFDGAAWSAVGAPFDGTVRALVVHDDGNGAALYAGGDFTHVGALAVARVARWDGASWSAVGAGFDGAVRALASYQGRLYAGGSFTMSGVTSTARIARLEGGAWSPLGAGASAPVHALAVHDDGSGARLYAGGDFASAGGLASSAVAAWDGSSWHACAAGVVGGVRALASWTSHGVTELIAGGNFRFHEGLFGLHVARWTGAEWRALTEGFTWQGGPSGPLAVARYDDGSGTKTYVTTAFSDAGGRTVGTFARWNGERWEPAAPVDPAPDAGVLRLVPCDLGFGPELLFVGQFQSIGGIACSRIARWSSSGGFAPLGEGLPAEPAGVFVDGSGASARVYAGAPQSSLTWGLSNAVKVWDGATWQTLGTLHGPVRAFAVYDDGTGPSLYAAGRFGIHPNGASSHVARFDGTAWVQVGGPTPYTAGGAYDLEVWDDGNGAALYLSGALTDIGGSGARAVGRWDGSAWTPVGDLGPVYGSVYQIAVFDDGSGRGERLYTNSDTDLHVFDSGVWSNVAFSNYADLVPTSFVVLDDDALAERELWWLGNHRTIEAGGEIASTIRVVVVRACDELGLTYCHGDGSEGSCPCGNASASGERQGCAHSGGSGGALRARGRASLSADTLSLDGASMTSSSALYFQSTSRGAPVPFGDGIKCTSGTFVRLGTKSNVAGASRYPSPGDATVSVRGHVLAPATRHYQVRYRNAAAFCTSDTFNYTNAVAVEWGA